MSREAKTALIEMSRKTVPARKGDIIALYANGKGKVATGNDLKKPLVGFYSRQEGDRHRITSTLDLGTGKDE